MGLRARRARLASALVVGALAATIVAAPAGAAVVHVRLTAKPATVRVAPGVRMHAWTFNGTVPAPTIHVRQGDTVRVTLHNAARRRCTGGRAKRRGHHRGRRAAHRGRAHAARRHRARKRRHCTPGMFHSIDFHAARVAPSVDFKNIAPGKTFTFSFVAERPGVFMYHCGTSPVLEHVGKGMRGMIIVDPATPRPPVAKEVALVQGEFYGTVRHGWLHTSLKAMETQVPRFVVFNGRADRYVRRPIRVPVGKPVRIYLVDAGPTLDSDFHVIGNMFDVYEHDGNPLEPLHDVSTALVPAGGAAMFELTFPQAGTYPFLTHSLRSANAGAIGYFVAGRPKTR